MGFTNQTTSNLADLITKLDTFLVGEGWTSDQLSTGTGRWAIHKNNVYVSARWDTSAPSYLGLYQALGYTGGNDPGNHPNDSGNGAICGTNATLAGARGVDIGNTPVQFWCFTNSTDAKVVVQLDNDPDFVHFGFGSVEKFGSWTGGEYLYGQRFFADSSAHAVTTASSFLLDGNHQTTGSSPDAELFAATVHCESLPNQSGSGKWAVCLGNQSSSSLGLDRAGNSRLHMLGTCRANLWATFFGRHTGSSEKGLVSSTTVGLIHWNRTLSNVAVLGYMKDVRYLNVQFFSAGQEVTVGSETWVVFPQRRKSTNSPPASSSANSTGYSGAMYKKS